MRDSVCTTAPRAPGPHVALVCFDLGRVLVAIASGWADACGRAGLAVPSSLDDPAVSRRLHELLHPLELGHIDLETHTREVAACTGLSEAAVARAVASWLLDPYPGAELLLADVRASGCATACLSNTNGYHWPTLLEPHGRYGRLFEGLEYRFASHLLGAAKPDTEAYARVEVETGIAPDSIVFFDDLDANVEAARARGWRAYRICDADPIARMRELLQAEGVLEGSER